jgi:hypothetical protein
MNDKLTALVAHHLNIPLAEAVSSLISCKLALLYHDPSDHEEIIQSILSLPPDWCPLILLYEASIDIDHTANILESLSQHTIADPDFDYIYKIFTMEV